MPKSPQRTSKNYSKSNDWKRFPVHTVRTLFWGYNCAEKINKFMPKKHPKFSDFFGSKKNRLSTDKHWHSYKFLSIFRNEITTILMPSTSEGAKGVGRGGHVFRFGGLQIRNVNMIFTWLVRIHPWVNPIVFGNNWLNRTTDIGENVPSNPVLRVYVRWYGGFQEKIWKQYLESYFPQKGYIHFVVRHSFPQRKLWPSQKYFSALF